MQGGTWTHRFGGVIFCTTDNGGIFIIDPETCDIETIGSSGTGELMDLSYNPSCDTLYGMSTKNLYKINMTNGKATKIGSMGNPGLMYSLDCDNNYNIYGLELGFPAIFYSINNSNGRATKIGSIGLSINYKAHLAYDRYDEIMYLCVLNYDTLRSELYTINVSTGQGTFVDIFPPDGIYVNMFTIPYNWTNQPPNPPKIDGPTNGKVGLSYKFNFSLSDVDNNPMYLRVDWGNGTSGPWQGLYASYTMIELYHTWNQQGTFTIRAQSKDIYNAESPWSELVVTMPKNKATFNSLFLWFLDQFPIIQKLFLGLGFK